MARSVSGADKIILQQLELLGLYWDEDVVYQSKRLDLYQTALEKLESKKITYPCCCTRKEIGDKVYPGICRKGIKPGKIARSIRIKTDNNPVGITDKLQGEYSQQLQSETGDFIIKRADGYFAYHLATAIDDACQNITEVVRGLDLLESTPRQVYLQKQLGLPTPYYLHLPIAIDKTGKKISKSDNAKSLSKNNPEKTIGNALSFLGHSPPEQILESNVENILNWAIMNWDIGKLSEEKEIMVNQSYY